MDRQAYEEEEEEMSDVCILHVCMNETVVFKKIKLKNTLNS